VVPSAQSSYFGFSASRNGVLAYLTERYWASKLLWFDLEGKPIGTVGGPGIYGSVSLSPDDKRVAVTVVTSMTPLYLSTAFHKYDDVFS
jgi:hypothetical protein